MEQNNIVASISDIRINLNDFSTAKPFFRLIQCNIYTNTYTILADHIFPIYRFVRIATDISFYMLLNNDLSPQQLLVQNLDSRLDKRQLRSYEIYISVKPSFYLENNLQLTNIFRIRKESCSIFLSMYCLCLSQ